MTAPVQPTLDVVPVRFAEMLRRAHAAYAAALARCTAAGHDLTAGACNECRGAVRREREEARRG